MESALWALAFTLLPWPERQKAECWDQIQAGRDPALPDPWRRDLERLEREIPRLRAQARDRGARLALPGEPEVDRLLRPLPYPVALWVRGSLPPAGPAVAMVGSREAARPALDRARSWARALTAHGVAVVSGLARGIDGAAHTGALEAGPTWGVMGSGLEHPYPPEHKPLMDRIVVTGGGVITPFPPEARPLKWHFPRRNWLLAAWTDGVLVTEARLRSGSLVTARLALDLGKELFVVPGSEGPDTLLQEASAYAVEHPSELLELLQEVPPRGDG